MSVPTRDWTEWHQRYDDPASPLSRRLVAIQRLIRGALAGALAGPVRVVSMCAGQGRDLLGALDGHPRRADVRARLVELDPRNVAVARAAVSAAGLDVEVVEADAALTDAYVGAVPAGLVLVCGVFGNVNDADVERIIGHLPGFCGPAATVIWTRHRRPPDLTPRIRDWFARAGFVQIAYEAPLDEQFGIGVHWLPSDPTPLPRGLRLFTFTR